MLLVKLPLFLFIFIFVVNLCYFFLGNFNGILFITQRVSVTDHRPILSNTNSMNQRLWFSRLLTGLWMTHRPLHHQKVLLHYRWWRHRSCFMEPCLLSTSFLFVLAPPKIPAEDPMPYPFYLSLNNTSSANIDVTVSVFCLFHCHSFGAKVISTSW